MSSMSLRDADFAHLSLPQLNPTRLLGRVLL